MKHWKIDTKGTVFSSFFSFLSWPWTAQHGMGDENSNPEGLEKKCPCDLNSVRDPCLVSSFSQSQRCLVFSAEKPCVSGQSIKQRGHGCVSVGEPQRKDSWRRGPLILCLNPRKSKAHLWASPHFWDRPKETWQRLCDLNQDLNYIQQSISKGHWITILKKKIKMIFLTIFNLFMIKTLAN